MSNITLELNEEDAKDLQTIVMFALRYAQGRKTYAFSIISSWLIAHADIMQSWQLKKMGEEIENGVDMWKLDDWEKTEYLQVADKLKELAQLAEKVGTVGREETGTRESVRVKHDKD